MDQICVVTGATGFIANELIVQLLQHGYTVRGTVRSPGSLKRVTHLGKIAEAMQAALSFHPVDLLRPGSLDQVMQGAKYVFHVASPCIMQAEDAEKAIVEPALQVMRADAQGTRNTLESAARAGTVERVILTASTASMEPAIPDGTVITPEDWTSDATIAETPYPYSKVEAEKLAWKLAKEHKLDLVTILPSLVLGTVYTPDLATSWSVECMKTVLEGTGDLAFGELIDVGDVARAHILAATLHHAKGRYIVSQQDLMSPQEVAAALSKALPEYKFRPHGQGEKRQYCDNSKTLKELGMQLTPPDVFLPNMARCMVRLGLAKPVEQ